MKRQFLTAVGSLLIMVAFASFHLGCGLLDNSHTVTVVNETRGPATFGLDNENNIHNLAAGQSITINDVSSGTHAWAAGWLDSLGIPRIDDGGIEINGDVTIRITPSGVRL